MARVLRGDLFWADLSPVRGREQAGRRPVVVMSQDVFNARSETVIVMAVTSKEPGAQFPLTLDLPLTVLPKRSWVKIGQVRTISIDRLERKLGRVGDDEMAQLLEGLNEILGA